MRDGRIAPAVRPAAGVSVRGVDKSFGATRVLRGVDLDVAPGELLAVLGVSGAGKTTLLRILCGFERLDRGSIELGSRLVAGPAIHVPPERRGVGYVAQDGSLFPHLDVMRNILFGLPRSQRHAGRTESRVRVEELLALVDLPARYAARMPAALSGGEQQRVALARALAPRPALVLLDEPFSALDAGLRADTRAAVVASLRRSGATAILVTHDQDEALSTGQRVAVLQRGRVAQVASPQALYRFPVDPDVARFVGRAILVPGTLVADGVDCRFGRLAIAPPTHLDAPSQSDAVEVMIRPEQFRLNTPGSDAPHRESGRAVACVRKLDYFGHDAEVTLQAEDGFAFTASVSGMELPRVGDRVGFRLLGPVVVYPHPADADAPGGGTTAQRDGIDPVDHDPSRPA